MISGIDRQVYDFIAPNERIRPLRDVIVVKPLPVQWSDSVAVEWRGKVLRGLVTAVGPGTYPNIHSRGKRLGKDFHEVRSSKAFLPTDVKVGDIVELGGVYWGEDGKIGYDGYEFQTIVIDGIEHLLCTEKDVCFIANG